MDLFAFVWLSLGSGSPPTQVDAHAVRAAGCAPLLFDELDPLPVESCPAGEPVVRRPVEH